MFRYVIYMQIQRIVKKTGTGAHVILPASWIGKEVLVSCEEADPILRKSQIESLIDSKIQDAKQGY